MNFETCSTIYLRLIGEHFSDKYDKMLVKLNKEYKQSNKFLDKIEELKFCVAFDRKSYFRAQIKKIDQDKVVNYLIFILNT